MAGSVATIGLTNAPVTLSTPPNTGAAWSGPYQSQSAVLRFTGTLTANCVVTMPAPGFYIVENLCTVGAFYVQLHEVNDSCAACQKARRARSCRDRVDGLGRRCRFEMIEAMHRSALPPGSLLDRRDDARIGATSAEVAAHVFADLISGASMSLMDAGDRGHDLARCAIAALQRIVVEKGLLHPV